MERARSGVIASLGRDFSQSALAEVFSSSPADFEGAEIEIDFHEEFPASVAPRTIVFGPQQEYGVAFEAEHVVLRSQKSGSSRLVSEQFLHRTIEICLMELLMADLPRPFILSAERFGISLFYRELDFTKNQLVDILQKEQYKKDSDRMSPYVLIHKGASRYALPIKDNIDFTRSIPDKRRKKSALSEWGLSKDIRAMMDGYYTASEDDFRFISMRRGERKFNIPLHRASSSARGMSDFYFFLRHEAQPGHILIVDEPESHLDTANQILLARLLSRVVNSGIRVLITTHSDYLIKELNNLIMLSHIPADSDAVDILGYTKETPLPPDRVRAYVASEGGAFRCAVDRYGMDISLFDRTIDSINNCANSLAACVDELDKS